MCSVSILPVSPSMPALLLPATRVLVIAYASARGCFRSCKKGIECKRKANETLDELVVRLLAWNSGLSHSVYNVGLSAAKLEENTLVFQNILLFMHFHCGR